MLVLTRKEGQWTNLTATRDIPAGTVIRVAVVDVDRGRVRLGFDAPPAVKILRDDAGPAPTPQP